MSDELTAATVGDLRLEINIDAPRASVWRALTENIGAWWPADFYAGGEDGSRTFSLDPVPGGLMKESWDGGGGLVWGTVMSADPERTLQVQGTTFPNWGGPNIMLATWKLEETGSGTKLIHEESSIGRLRADHVEEKTAGWGVLFAALEAYVGGER